MSAQVVTRPNEFSAAGGVWRNPIRYVIASSTLEYVIVEVYKVGSLSDTLIGKLRTRVIHGQAVVDISAVLKDGFTTGRNYPRNTIALDENASFAYYIKYNTTENVTDGPMASEETVKRLVFNAALEVEDSNYITYVVGEEAEVTDPEIIPDPVPEFYISTIIPGNSTPQQITDLCSAPAFRRVYADAEEIVLGVTLYTDQALTTPVTPPGFARVFTDINTSFRVIIGLDGEIITKFLNCP